MFYFSKSKYCDFCDCPKLAWLNRYKPEEYYSVIRRISPGPYLELFARRPEPGFDAWGNEIPSDIVIPGYPVPLYSGRVNTNPTDPDSPDTAKEA